MRSQHSTDTVSEFHAEEPQATASEGLAQGPYVEARTGFEPATLWTKGDESTNEPQCSTIHCMYQTNSSDGEFSSSAAQGHPNQQVIIINTTINIIVYII